MLPVATSCKSIISAVVVRVQNWPNVFLFFAQIKFWNEMNKNRSPSFSNSFFPLRILPTFFQLILNPLIVSFDSVRYTNNVPKNMRATSLPQVLTIFCQRVILITDLKQKQKCFVADVNKQSKNSTFTSRTWLVNLTGTIQIRILPKVIGAIKSEIKHLVPFFCLLNTGRRGIRRSIKITGQVTKCCQQIELQCNVMFSINFATATLKSSLGSGFVVIMKYSRLIRFRSFSNSQMYVFRQRNYFPTVFIASISIYSRCSQCKPER